MKAFIRKLSIKERQGFINSIIYCREYENLVENIVTNSAIVLFDVSSNKKPTNIAQQYATNKTIKKNFIKSFLNLDEIFF